MVLAALGSAAVGVAVSEVAGVVGGDRSVVCEVDNDTDLYLVHARNRHDHGGFAKTPADIPPRQALVFGSQDIGIGTGTEGSVDFTADGFALSVSWNNPFIGSNECGAGISGSNTGRYVVDQVCGSGNTDAHMRYVLTQLPFIVIGAIRDKWLALGGRGGLLGFPTTDELATPDGVGRFNHFQGGSVYWRPETGAFEVHGAIAARWAATGFETGLGYPITDETATPDGRGRFNHFRAFIPGGPFDASIYWTPQTGAQRVFGAIRHAWALQGWETGRIGYPTGEETPQPDGSVVQTFERGRIVWHPATGAVVQG